MRRMASIALLLSLALTGGSALAQDGAARACAEPDPATAIDGCSAVIAAGGVKGMTLAEAHFNRGLAWAQKNRHVKALADYDAAVRLGPKDAALLQSRCWSRAVLGRLSQALQDCDAALALAPNDPDTLAIRDIAVRRIDATAAAQYATADANRRE